MARSNMYVGKIMGAKTLVDYSWAFLFAAVLASFVAWSLKYAPYMSTGETIVLAVVVSLLSLFSVWVHETAHSLYARAKGIAVERSTLFIFGGVSELNDEAVTPGQEARVAAVGPLASVLLGIAFGAVGYLGIAIGNPPLILVSELLMAGNVALALINILPGLPFDGGHIFSAVIRWKTGDIEKATTSAANTGRLLAGLVMLGGAFVVVIAGAYAAGVWVMMVGWFIYAAADQSHRLLLARFVLRGKRVKDFMVAGKKAPLNLPAASSVSFRPNDPALTAAAGARDAGRDEVPVVSRGHFVGSFSQKKLDRYVRHEFRHRHVTISAR